MDREKILEQKWNLSTQSKTLHDLRETLVFQMKIYVKEQCAQLSTGRKYKEQDIEILSDSQVFNQAFGFYEVNSVIAWDCLWKTAR